MSRWFRHYAGMMRDEKLVSCAVKSGQTVERVVWLWGAILESAAEINDHGKFAVDTAEIAYFLRADQADLDRIISVLQELNRLAGDRVVKWGDRQFASDRSADRTRAYRDRHKERSDDNDQNVASAECDGVVTAIPDGFFAPASYRLPRQDWEVLRSAVFERDNYTCQYCGSRGGRLECDHIVPVSRGGDDDIFNLSTACFSCNRSKRNKTIGEWLQ